MTEEPPRRRRWYQFRLRTVLIAIVVLSLPLSWFAVEVERAKRQRKIGAIIEGAGGGVSYEPAEPSLPQRIREFFGDDSANVVVTAILMNEEFVNAAGEAVNKKGWDDFGDDEAKYLKELPDLTILSLSNTQVTDAGLENLKGLTNLKILNLDNTQVGDAGLEHLKGLASLEVLYLNNTHVTDAGLEHLEGLTGLNVLYLNDTQVTQEGVEKLPKTIRMIQRQTSQQ